MNAPFDDVQRIVLVGSPWQVARHLVLGFPGRSAPLHFLHGLMHDWPPATALSAKPTVQVSLGFSRRGLAHARVPSYVLACFAAKAPAFTAGAAMRAASHAGNSGRNGPAHWDQAFGFMALDAVLSLHASEEVALDKAVRAIQKLADKDAVRITALPHLRTLPPDGQLWVHFGYRDGLSRVGVKGATAASTEPKKCRPESKAYAAGEFLLGHPQESGANPWMATAGQRVWPDELRAFFRNGSFGVLHQLEQDVGEFEAFVTEAAKATTLTVDQVKGKLCGRTPEGVPLAGDPAADPHADFDYANDSEGHGCPFGSHVRRMNPRGGALAQTRPRPLLRRGMPYGPSWQHPPENKTRGLIGHFFCASIEDQFEHLLGQWSDRIPLGSNDGGGARDPLMGAHETGDGGFEIPMKSGPAQMLGGLSPFTRTLGTAYLFYPSLTTLKRIADNAAFADLREDHE